MSTINDLEQIERIMKNFDFKFVHKIMVATNWRWAVAGQQGLNVPDLDYVKSTTEELLHEYSREERVGAFETGGFKVYRDNIGNLRLSFGEHF
jgi:hypothetical protein